MKWQQNNTITHSATASPSTSTRATHPRSHPLDSALLSSFSLFLSLSDPLSPFGPRDPMAGKEGEKKRRRRKKKRGLAGWLTDSLQVYSEIRKEQRVPVFILLTGTIIRPFLHPFSFPFHQVFLSVFFSPPPPSSYPQSSLGIGRPL